MRCKCEHGMVSKNRPSRQGHAFTPPAFFLLAVTGVQATPWGQEGLSHEQRMADQLERRDLGSW